jgi:hypothetical protein
MLHPSGTCRVWADNARRALFNGVTEIDYFATRLMHRPVPLGFPDRFGVVLRSAAHSTNGVRHYVAHRLCHYMLQPGRFIGRHFALAELLEWSCKGEHNLPVSRSINGRRSLERLPAPGRVSRCPYTPLALMRDEGPPTAAALILLTAASGNEDTSNIQVQGLGLRSSGLRRREARLGFRVRPLNFLADRITCDLNDEC